MNPDSHGQKSSPKTLAIDIGGTGLKMMVLDASGTPLTERDREKTPAKATPEAILAALTLQIERQPPFDRISVGFPGVVIDGVVRTAPNLGSEWEGFPLAARLCELTGRETRVADDADVKTLTEISTHRENFLKLIGDVAAEKRCTRDVLAMYTPQTGISMLQKRMQIMYSNITLSMERC